MTAKQAIRARKKARLDKRYRPQANRAVMAKVPTAKRPTV